MLLISLLFAAVFAQKPWLRQNGTESINPPGLHSEPTDRVVLVTARIERTASAAVNTDASWSRVKLDSVPFRESGVWCNMHERCFSTLAFPLRASFGVRELSLEFQPTVPNCSVSWNVQSWRNAKWLTKQIGLKRRYKPSRHFCAFVGEQYATVETFQWSQASSHTAHFHYRWPSTVPLQAELRIPSIGVTAKMNSQFGHSQFLLKPGKHRASIVVRSSSLEHLNGSSTLNACSTHHQQKKPSR